MGLAVRRFIREGIPEGVAILLAGHKTRAMPQRYQHRVGGRLARCGAEAGYSSRRSQLNPVLRLGKLDRLLWVLDC